jgi:hypothetical protein
MKAGWSGFGRSLPYTLSGTVKLTLGRGERRWDRIGAVHARRCLSVPWYLRAIDRMAYVTTFGISEGTWELWTCQFRETLLLRS